MKETIKKSLIGGLVFSFTVLTVFIVYALVDSTWTSPSTLEVGAGSPLSATSWNKLLSNFNNLNDKVNNFSFNSGNVGIGASPSLGAGEGLHVKSNIQPNAKIILEQGGISGGMNFSNSSNGLYLNSAREISFYPQNIITMTLTGTKVGIGTTTPTQRLDLGGGVIGDGNIGGSIKIGGGGIGSSGSCILSAYSDQSVCPAGWTKLAPGLCAKCQ